MVDWANDGLFVFVAQQTYRTSILCRKMVHRWAVSFRITLYRVFEYRCVDDFSTGKIISKWFTWDWHTFEGKLYFCRRLFWNRTNCGRENRWVSVSFLEEIIGFILWCFSCEKIDIQIIFIRFFFSNWKTSYFENYSKLIGTDFVKIFIKIHGQSGKFLKNILNRKYANRQDWIETIFNRVKENLK